MDANDFIKINACEKNKLLIFQLFLNHAKYQIYTKLMLNMPC